MKKLAACALLYVIASMPAYAVDVAPPYASFDLNTETLDASTKKNRQFIVERIESLSKFGLLQANDSFSMYGKLSFRHSGTGNGTNHSAPVYGLHGQFNSTHGIGIHFGWDRYIVKQSSGDNVYTLTATVQF